MSGVKQPAIIVHGGAGAWRLDAARLREALDGGAAAAEDGRALLLAGGSALDAVEAAVRLLEDAPILNAGRGSYLTEAGEVEMDALIMNGRTLDFGGVAAVRRVRNPISLARRVMTESRHSLLVAHGAEAFADAIGFPRCETSDLVTDAQLALHDAHAGDTVGAVALDSAGNLAAACSTGGIPHKAPGRVGDSPLVGSGAYADSTTAAATATGDGEALMKIVISKLVCDAVAGGATPQAACDAAIATLTARTTGHGGVIALDTRARVGVAFDTPAMPHAMALGDAPLVVRHEQNR